MRAPVLCLMLTVFFGTSDGQPFNAKFSFELPDSVSFYKLGWADADNDGLMDVMALATNPNDETTVFWLRNDSLRQFHFAGYLNTGMKKTASFITDLDGDNAIDLIVSGFQNGQPVTSAFLNRGGFGFERTNLFHVAADVLRFADFNQDGLKEILISGTQGTKPFLRILQAQPHGWAVVHDSISMAASGVEVFDFDGDYDQDFFVSGIDESGTKATWAFYNQHGFYFTKHALTPSLQGVSTHADLDHDGYFDILLAGKDAADQHRLVVFLNNGHGGFSGRDTLTAVTDPEIFAADLTSDGRCDVNVFGLAGTGDTLNVVFPASAVPHTRVMSQAFGDGEHDGDLDLLQLTKTPMGYGLRLLENATPARNFPPQRPSQPVVANIFNRLFMYWEKSSDDRTPINSVTYDVSIRSTGQDLMIFHVDLFNGKKLTVDHGNNGTANYVLIRTASAGPVSFDIQAVDNALHAGPGSICKGSGGEGEGLCSAVDAVNLEVCRNEQVTLTSASAASWFSFKDGFLAGTSALSFHFHEPDTIFSVTPGADCAEIKVYTLALAQAVAKITDTVRYVCENETLRLGVEGGWPAVEWSSAAKGWLSNEDSIDYVVTVPDTVSVRISDGVGCVIHRNTALKVSKPVIDAAHDAYQILKGQSVQLGVSGGSGYQWTPVSGLDDPQVFNPIASPLKTTEYVVTVKDSLGCLASASIVVMVEETAFVPNLFTPNRDGSNDVLKVYGLGQVTDFLFAIYNREGNRVYHTKDVSDALHRGWNGTAGGVDQPAGVYYWHVEGRTATGTRLRLNGRISGSIVLVR